MLTTAPHLLIRHPSPTTIEFTISTSPPSTLPVRLLLTLTHLLRLLLSLSILFLLYSKYLLSSYALPLHAYTPRPDILSYEFLRYALYRLTSSPLGQTFERLAAGISLSVLAPSALLALYLLSLRLHTTESLLVLRGLGIQTSSSSRSLLGGSTTRFIPTEKIQDMFINEAFRGFEVRYYLTVVVEGEEEIVVVFPRLLPRRKMLEVVWRRGRECLWEREKDEGDGKGRKG